MSDYRRRRGEQVSYSPDQSRRYMSQQVRWRRGMQIQPHEVQQVGDSTVYRFRSDRATDGMWEATYTPGAGDGDEFPPFDLGSSSCGSGPCLSNLQYIRSVLTVLNQSWVDRLGGGWYTDGPNSYTLESYLRFPGSPVPPEPWFNAVAIGSCSAVSGCSSYITSSDFDSVITTPYPGVFRFTDYAVCRNGILYSLASISNGGHYDAPPSPVYPDPGGGTSGADPMERVINTIEFTSYFGTPQLSTSTCGYSVPGFPVDGDPVWSCNCPDQTQQQSFLPQSPFSSERFTRSWSGSDSHTSEDGPCKHIYSAAFYRGEPFPLPTGGNFWDYPYQPERIRLDWAGNEPTTPNPADWSEAEYRAWRQQRFQRRRYQRMSQRSDRIMLDRLFRRQFDQLGVADRSVPRNRYLQAEYRRRYREAHAPGADPNLLEALFEFEMGLSRENE